MAGVTGQPISGTLTTGLLGLGSAWTADITITATLNDSLGTAIASTTDALVAGHIADAALDALTTDAAGDLLLSGTYQCPSESGRHLLVVTDGRSAENVTTSLDCDEAAAHPQAWSATLILSAPGTAGRAAFITPTSPAAFRIQPDERLAHSGDQIEYKLFLDALVLAGTGPATL